MTPQLYLHPLSPDVAVTIEPEPLEVPAHLAPVVEAVWEHEQAHRGGTLFNGRTLSVLSHAPDLIHTRIVEYRLVLAARRRPDLFTALAIRPLAVSGLLRCADGIVFGRRGPGVTTDSGLWELVPSGGLDAADRQACGPRQQILTELVEEVGLDATQIRDCRPFCLIEDRTTGVFDIGVALQTDLEAGAVEEAQRRASDEYSELRIVPDHRVAEFLAGGAILPASRLLLECASDRAG